MRAIGPRVLTCTESVIAPGPTGHAHFLAPIRQFETGSTGVRFSCNVQFILTIGAAEPQTAAIFSRERYSSFVQCYCSQHKSLHSVMFMAPRTRNLILNLLLATEGQSQSARETIASCALFRIRENSVRVALVRLAADGLIEPVGRGAYRLGPGAAALAADVATWRTAEQRVRDWSGGWIVAHVGALGRSNRVRLRARDRALAMLGLRELERGLYVRPDNLAGGVQ